VTKLIFGCGYLGERVATRWRGAGDDVAVVARRPERAVGFAARGYETIIADVTRPDTLRNLPLAETVLFAVGYDRLAGQSIEKVYAGGMQNVLAALPSKTGRIIYTSTTGVYGPAGGDWVDEHTPPDPRRDGGRASFAAEQALTSNRLGQCSVVLRLAGLYGPGRIPFVELLRAGLPIPAPTDGYLNLIHADDAASVVLAAAGLAPFDDGPRIYCVSDGHPVVRGEYYRELARQIGATAPRFTLPEPGSPKAMRAGSSRRVRNSQMLHGLGVKLAYPDYRAGLAATLETQNQLGGH
jgi:nucleoside-diphosphate-sugar epimerase